jgi:hypothetical protein
MRRTSTEISRGAISIALPSPAVAFHPPCHRPAIELPSPAIDGSPSPYNPRPMETGLSGLMPSAGSIGRGGRRPQPHPHTVCRPLYIAKPLPLQTNMTCTAEQRARSATSVRQTVARKARNAAFVSLCARGARFRPTLGSAWEAAPLNRAPLCCRQTLQHRALPANATAPTERESYGALSGIRRIPGAGFAARSRAATARLYAPG